MSTIGVRDLARHASSIISNLEQTREPALITRRGRPVAYMLPVDSEQFEDFVLGLINTQTADTSKPTTTEDKVFTDSMDPSKFNGLFP